MQFLIPELLTSQYTFTFDHEDEAGIHTVFYGVLEQDGSLDLSLPGLDYFSLHLGFLNVKNSLAFELVFPQKIDLNQTSFSPENYAGPLEFRWEEVPVVLEFSQDWLKPIYIDEDENGKTIFEPGTEAEDKVSFTAYLTLIWSPESGLRLEPAVAFECSHDYFAIGETGIILGLSEQFPDFEEPGSIPDDHESPIVLDFSPGGAGFRLNHLSVWPFAGLMDKVLPDPFDPAIVCGYLQINRDGLSCEIAYQAGESENPGVFELRTIEIEVKDNITVRASLNAKIDLSDELPQKLPALQDQLETAGGPIFHVDLNLTYNPELAFPKGIGFSGTLSADQPNGITAENGILEVSAEGPLEKLALTQLGVHYGWDESADQAKLEITFDVLTKINLEGVLSLDQPLEFRFSDLKLTILPEFSLSAGKLEELWLPLDQEYAVDFGVFSGVFSRFGFGEEAGRRYLGMDVHSIRLPLGLDLEASVKGMRLWYTRFPQINDFTLDGLGLHFAAAGVLDFTGSFQYDRSQDLIGGRMDAELPALGMHLAAALEVAPDAFFVAIEGKFAQGIQLLGTGSSLYGLSALFGYNYKPNLPEGGDYYEDWYKAPPAYEIVDPQNANKWKPSDGHMALGMGALIGTAYDKGWSLNSKVSLLVLTPGPVIIIMGKADLLQTPPALEAGASGAEGSFSLMAVLDFEVGEFKLDLEVMYAIPRLFEFNIFAQAYFNFEHPSHWHLYIGQDQPPEKRLKVEVLKLFKAYGFLMLDGQGLQLSMGGRELPALNGPAIGFGFEAGFSFGIDWKVLVFRVEAWFGAALALGLNPATLAGLIYAEGSILVKVIGIKFSLSLRAELMAIAPEPYHVHGKFRIKIGLPWPIPDIKASLKVSWGAEDRMAAAGPVLNTLAAQSRQRPERIEIFRSEGEAPPTQKIPMDSLLSLVFHQPLNGPDLPAETLIGSTQQAFAPVHDAFRYRFEVKGISLTSLTHPGRSHPVFGAWQNDGTEANRHLMLLGDHPSYFANYLNRLPVGEENLTLDCEAPPAGQWVFLNFDPYELGYIGQELEAEPQPGQVFRLTAFPEQPTGMEAILAGLAISSPDQANSFTAIKIEERRVTMNNFQVYKRLLRVPLRLGEEAGLEIELPPCTQFSMQTFHEADTRLKVELFDDRGGSMVQYSQTDGFEQFSMLAGQGRIHRLKITTLPTVHTTVSHRVGNTTWYNYNAAWILMIGCFAAPVVEENGYAERVAEQGAEILEWAMTDLDQEAEEFNAYADRYLLAPGQWKLRLQTDYVVQDPQGLDLPSDRQPQNRTELKEITFETGGLPEDLNPWIATQFPSPGADQIYFEYDLVTVYNRFYIQRMYEWENDRLAVRTYRNGSQQLRMQSESRRVVEVTDWDAADLTWFNQVEQAECIPGSWSAVPGLEMANVFLLEPETTYRITKGRVRNPGNPGFEMEFRTGKYRNFRHHVNCFSPALARTLGPVPEVSHLQETVQPEVRERVVETSFPSTWFRAFQEGAGQREFLDFWTKILRQPLPIRPEHPNLQTIWMPFSGGHRPWFLFIDGPVRLWDPQRVVLTLKCNGQEVPCYLLATEDGTRMILLSKSRYYLNPGTYTLRLDYLMEPLEGGGARLSRRGLTSDESCTLAFSIGTTPQKYL